MLEIGLWIRKVKRASCAEQRHTPKRNGISTFGIGRKRILLPESCFLRSFRGKRKRRFNLLIVVAGLSLHRANLLVRYSQSGSCKLEPDEEQFHVGRVGTAKVLLTLTALLGRELHRHGIQLSIPALLETLSGIHEVAVIYPPIEEGRRQKDHMTLTERNPMQQQIMDLLNLDRYVVV